LGVYLIPACLAGLSSSEAALAVEKTVELCSHSAQAIRTQATFALGGLEWPVATDSQELIISALIDRVKAGTDDPTKASAIRALHQLTQLGHLQYSTWIDLAIASNEIDHLTSQYAFSLILADENSQEGLDEFFDAIFAVVSSVPAQNRGTLNNLDSYIGSCLQDESRLQLGLDLLERLLTRADGDVLLEALEMSLFNAAASQHISAIITRWFLLCHPNLWLSAYELINNCKDDCHLHFVPDLYDNPPIEIDAARVFVARKAIGYFFSKPNVALSLAMDCALKCDVTSAREAIMSLVLNPLLMSYHSLRERLSQDANSQRFTIIKPSIQGIIDGYDFWMESLKQAPDLPELRPSLQRREEALRRMQRTTAESYKEAEKRSVFMQLVSKQMILYGNSTVHYMESAEGPVRSESRMGSHSFSFEMPRLTQLDSWNLDLQLRVFRNEKIRASP